MKVNDYLPLYNLYHTNFESNIYIKTTDAGKVEVRLNGGQKISVCDFLEQYEELELPPIILEQLDIYDKFALQSVLNDEYFTPQTVGLYLRELFDNYKDNGGDPVSWLNETWLSIRNNPQNYKAEIRTVIEKTLLDIFEVYSKIEPKTKNGKVLPTLEDIFSDKKRLNTLVEVLVEKGFVERTKSGSLRWTGIDKQQAKGKGKQLIALTEVCKPLYKRREYEQKELHHAWTTYFNFDLAQNMFSEAKRPPEDSQYHKLFTYLLTSI